MTLSSRVEMEGDRTLTLEFDPEPPGSYPVEEKRLTLPCSSGGRITRRWRGIPMSELLEQSRAPDQTTHLLVEGEDEHRVCIEIGPALEGLLAFEQDGEWLAGPRFVAPGINAARAVHHVHRIRAIQVSSRQEKDRLESFAT